MYFRNAMLHRTRFQVYRKSINMITQSALYPPQPATTRASSTFISYDAVNNRIAYASGKGIVIRSLDFKHSPVLFTKHTFTTTVATFSPSGYYIASGDESGQVKIWDTSIRDGFDQPVVKSEFQILGGPIRSIAWDADSSRVIAVGQGKDKFGHCFTWDSGNSIGEIQGHSETINDVTIRPVRPYRAATVGDDKAMVFFNGPPFKFDKSVRGNHTNSVRAVKFSPDGQWLVSVGSDRSIVIYDGKTGEFVRKIENAHDGGIFGISWFPDSSSFVTASADNTLKRWKDFEQVHVYTANDSVAVDYQQVGVVVTKEFVVSLSLNGNINLFKHDETAPHVTYGHQSSLTAALVTGATAITGGSDGSLMEWKVENTKVNEVPAPLGKQSDKHGNYVTSIVSAGNAIVSTGWDDKLKVWVDGQVTHTLEFDAQPKQVIYNGNLIILFESKIEVYSDYKLANSVSLTFPASCMDLAGTKLLVNNQAANKVEEYDIGTLLHTRSYPVLRAAPTLIKVSPDGEYAAIADNTGKYTLYKTDDLSVVTTRWAFHSSRVNDAQWTADSKFLISGGLDSGLFLYSVERPSKVLKFPLAHQNGVTGLAWLGEDSFVSTGMDGAVKAWSVDFSAYK